MGGGLSKKKTCTPVEENTLLSLHAQANTTASVARGTDEENTLLSGTLFDRHHMTLSQAKQFIAKGRADLQDQELVRSLLYCAIVEADLEMIKILHNKNIDFNMNIEEKGVRREGSAEKSVLDFALEYQKQGSLDRCINLNDVKKKWQYNADLKEVVKYLVAIITPPSSLRDVRGARSVAPTFLQKT